MCLLYYVSASDRSNRPISAARLADALHYRLLTRLSLQAWGLAEAEKGGMRSGYIEDIEDNSACPRLAEGIVTSDWIW